MDRRCDSSSKLPALPEQSPEFKFQCHQKQRKKEKENDKLIIKLLWDNINS
jgi:hypothetical protein